MSGSRSRHPQAVEARPVAVVEPGHGGRAVVGGHQLDQVSIDSVWRTPGRCRRRASQQGLRAHFRPDAKGTTFTDLSTAVDPDDYSVLAITRERTDGDPGPTLPDVTRSDWSRRANNGER